MVHCSILAVGGLLTLFNAEKEKATYPALYGLDESKKKAEKLVEEGIACLEVFGAKAEPLREIGRFFLQRTF